MSEKHTRSWIVREDHGPNNEPLQDGLCVATGNGPGSRVIAGIVRCGSPWPCREGLAADLALAHLIATVPELLEACEAAMRKIEAYEDCPAAGVIAAEDMPEEWELCRAALAKAKPAQDK